MCVNININENGYKSEYPSREKKALILTILAIRNAEELIRRYLDTPFEVPIQLALDKIKQHLPEHVS